LESLIINDSPLIKRVSIPCLRIEQAQICEERNFQIKNSLQKGQTRSKRSEAVSHNPTDKNVQPAKKI
jgi:hypothetical protein